MAKMSDTTLRDTKITDNDLLHCPFCHGTKGEIVENGSMIICHCGARYTFKASTASLDEIQKAQKEQESMKIQFEAAIKELTNGFNEKIQSLETERETIKKDLAIEKGKYTKLRNELTSIKEILASMQMPKSDSVDPK